jgi:hypothetical protein
MNPKHDLVAKQVDLGQCHNQQAYMKTSTICTEIFMVAACFLLSGFSSHHHLNKLLIEDNLTNDFFYYSLLWYFLVTASWI